MLNSTVQLFAKCYDNFQVFSYNYKKLYKDSLNIFLNIIIILIYLIWVLIAYYACGMAVRVEGAAGAREAFVLLNRCLDLVEAADDDSAHLLDYTDFGK